VGKDIEGKAGDRVVLSEEGRQWCQAHYPEWFSDCTGSITVRLLLRHKPLVPTSIHNSMPPQSVSTHQMTGGGFSTTPKKSLVGGSALSSAVNFPGPQVQGKNLPWPTFLRVAPVTGALDRL